MDTDVVRVGAMNPGTIATGTTGLLDNTSSLSTLALTLLMGIGLFFFIRASVKERLQSAQLSAPLSADQLSDRLQGYFQQRAYRVINPEVAPEGDPESTSHPPVIALEGFVQPSRFLAIFLSSLAAVGLVCLTLVWVTLAPSVNPWAWFSVLAAPLAGWFYWIKAGRVERITYQVLGSCEMESPTEATAHSQVRVTAHRDEIIALQASLALTSDTVAAH